MMTSSRNKSANPMTESSASGFTLGSRYADSGGKTPHSDAAASEACSCSHDDGETSVTCARAELGARYVVERWESRQAMEPIIKRPLK